MEQLIPDMDPHDMVMTYHEETKHHFDRYARSLGYMDWANQPNPFRRFDGAPLIRLPLLPLDGDPISPQYDDLYDTHSVETQPVTIRTISRFFEYALAVSAWKQAGTTRWALRCNPSSGNLHPTEGYLIAGTISGLESGPGVYHYAPREHGLEQRATFAEAVFPTLMNNYPSDAFVVGLTSIHWREAWKYGERAFRYCQHDVGHAIGAIRIAAATLGWNMLLLDDQSDGDIETLLGLNRKEDFDGAEPEAPECIAVVFPHPWDASHTPPLALDATVLNRVWNPLWAGKANRLSRDPVFPWSIIDAVSTASRRGTIDERAIQPTKVIQSNERVDGSHTQEATLSAGQIIRQRRSAVAFDGTTSISMESFFTMLARVVPCSERGLVSRPMPWDAVPWEPSIHLAIFVHRVVGLTPGLYVLVRDLNKLDALKQSFHSHFPWQSPTQAPKDIPLFLLEEGAAQECAVRVSCGQDIAGMSAFSLGMIAEFEPTLRKHGPSFYPRLFWETGIIGQVLYLEAEAAGVRATGIGCFFDDPVHQLLGISDRTFQSLYHFTTGGAVDDPRLTTLPAYDEDYSDIRNTRWVK